MNDSMIGLMAAMMRGNLSSQLLAQCCQKGRAAKTARKRPRRMLEWLNAGG